LNQQSWFMNINYTLSGFQKKYLYLWWRLTAFDRFTPQTCNGVHIPLEEALVLMIFTEYYFIINVFLMWKCGSWHFFFFLNWWIMAFEHENRIASDPTTWTKLIIKGCLWTDLP
jgi:hypothetical protein